MKRFFEKVFKIYPDELKLFLWVTALLFTTTASIMFLNNYAETVFLKRYGVEKLPKIYLANAIITFILMNYMMVILRRMTTVRMLRWLFVICPAAVVSLRFALMFPGIVYPLFFILKAQFETLLLLMFWNMGNELFSTRQSKRIFPLIMAGGVLGRICGSAFTGVIVSHIRIDNIVFVYAFLQLAACAVTIFLEKGFTTFGAQKMVKAKKKKSAFIEELKAIVPLAKDYKLFRILVIVTLMSNLMIPAF